MIDLEKEYGSLLDLIAEHLDSEELLHFGVKGMKWGVHKERPASVLQQLGPSTIERTTAKGEKITLSQSPPNRLNEWLGRHSEAYRKEFASAAYFTIKDKDGKAVGDAAVQKRSKDELYLSWLGIDKSARGKGYATAVMKASEEFGSKEGFKKLTLEVPGNSPDARHIYEKLGFKVVEESKSGKKDPVWGGLSKMEYTFDNVKHADPSRLELVVVAIPREDDYVWKVSSEPVPHMTLLYLGQVDWSPEQIQNVSLFIQHAASQLHRFWMSVDRRGTLGAQEADVLFFDKGINNKLLDRFRTNLLVDRDISTAYQSATQYDQWTPHLTLGYPETPAKPDTRDFGFNGVEFDKIALWTSDSDGPTFQLKSWADDELEVAMSDIQRGTDLEAVLEHHGVKGMKWGQHKKSRQTEATSHDAARVGDIKTRVKTQKTTKILSNQELRDALDRMRLEQEFSKLSGGLDKTRIQKSKEFVAKLLIDTGKQSADQAVKTKARTLVDEAVKKAK